jgi:uncharacterized protein
MTLEQRINDDYVVAMRAGEEERKQTIRLLRSALRYATIEARHPLDDAGVLAVLRREAKQRHDSIAQYQQGGRMDLVAVERAELTIIESYLPQSMSAADIEALARQQIAAVGATSAGDVGKVMGPLMKSLAGRADGNEVNTIVRRLLGA